MFYLYKEDSKVFGFVRGKSFLSWPKGNRIFGKFSAEESLQAGLQWISLGRIVGALFANSSVILFKIPLQPGILQQ